MKSKVQTNHAHPHFHPLRAMASIMQLPLLLLLTLQDVKNIMTTRRYS